MIGFQFSGQNKVFEQLLKISNMHLTKNYSHFKIRYNKNEKIFGISEHIKVFHS